MLRPSNLRFTFYLALYLPFFSYRVVFMRSFALAFSFLCLSITPLVAQVSKEPATAITQAKIIISPTKVIEKGSIVIKDGKIITIGEKVEIPLGSRIIDGTGLVVSSSWVDAQTSRGFDPAQKRTLSPPAGPEDLASDVLAATKPDHRRGLMPEFEVRTATKPDDPTFAEWRKAGFTVQLAAPEGSFLSGQSAVISLGGKTPREMILRSPVFEHGMLRTIPGAEYPRALMGVIAHLRQLFLDADRHSRLIKKSQEGGGAERVPADPCLESVALILQKKLPLCLEADTSTEINRALDFAEEFKITVVISGGRDAWKVKDRLASTKTPVILKLAFSEAPEKEKDIPALARVERERQRAEEVACANVLQSAGVKISFSTNGITGDKPVEKFRANLQKAIKAGLSQEAALAALTTNGAELLGVAPQVGTLEIGKYAHLQVTTTHPLDSDSQTKLVFVDGVKYEFDVVKKDPPKIPPVEKKPEVIEPRAGEEIETDAMRKPKLQGKGIVLLKNATIITCGKQGTIEKGEIELADGKIQYVGPARIREQPINEKVIDLGGCFVMPGIIDTHAHFAISGGVNEFSLSVVPEVRVRDVIESEDVQIYRALAGGVTTARLLHGSANVIGGQDAVIKLKWGRSAKELLVTDGPRGVKFALGENVKRTDGRFPNSRMGVEAVLIRAFSEAKLYQKQWDDYRAAKGTLPEPRRDLRLEALAEILSGDIKVHCHCYRSDEILMLLRVADRFGVKIKSLQHVLEGYKVGPEIAAHGASCSLFSDWWAYKIEAFDAIPFAAALMQESGVDVCLKSDSNELVRHLYQEAAKLVKYGSMDPEDALKTITLNPAKQLGLDSKIGSIEVGKQADLAIFNGHPLNGFSRCEMTLVEGEVYFQKSETLKANPIAIEGPKKPTPRPIVLPKGDTPQVIVNAIIHTGEGKSGRGVVVIEKGKILSVTFGTYLKDADIADLKKGEGIVVEPAGKKDERIIVKVPKDFQVFDANGFHLYPGMIDAGTVLGLTELGQSKETQDFAEGGEFQPDLRAAAAINPDSELIPVTRANGVLTVVTRPIGPTVAGQAAMINLNGWTPKDMTVRDPVALHIEFPSEIAFNTGDPTMPALGRAIAKKQREEKIRKLKELWNDAKAYEQARSESRGVAPINPRLEALIPFVRGERPVIVTAFRKPEILDALKLSEELGFKMILSGAVDAWKVADDLKKKDIPVIIGPVMTMPQEWFDPYDSPFTNAAKLQKAGVRFCIRSNGSSNTRNLPYEAAMAVSYGLSPEEALKAVTLTPAKFFGLEKELGTITAGKRANLVLTTGDILQPSTQVHALWIDGKPLEPTSKQTKLYDKYKERLQEFKSGKTPLGTK